MQSRDPLIFVVHDLHRIVSFFPLFSNDKECYLPQDDFQFFFQRIHLYLTLRDFIILLRVHLYLLLQNFNILLKLLQHLGVLLKDLHSFFCDCDAEIRQILLIMIKERQVA